MRRIVFAAFGLLLSCMPAIPQTLPQKVWNLQSPMVDLGDYQCTSISIATTLLTCASLSAVPAGAVFAVVQVESNAARWRTDGTAPTASVGQPLAVLTPIYFTVNPLSNVQLIPQSSTMTIDVSFYGVR